MRGMLVALMLAGSSMTAWAGSGLVGDWATSAGSVVRIAECGGALCMTVVKVSPDAKASTDKMNPDDALKGRPLCGLRIGEGFHADGDNAAKDGKIYDPESGKTYNGKMMRDGDRLKLRGFLGVSLFGRTETWTRAVGVSGCG